MTDEFERLPDELRASLNRHAREAPRGDLLAERIIHAADQQAAGRRRGWRTWSLPLIAAFATAGVVASVVGIASYRPTASGPAQNSNSSGVETPSPSTTPSDSVSTSLSPSDGGPLQDVQIVDATFVSDNEGWALATADCVSTAGRCSALYHTTNGTHWWSMANSTPFNVPGVAAGCDAKCVTNIRFATPKIGYAYGPSTFLMSTDGGRHWTPQTGGAVALETLDNNVIRVTTTGGGCPLWCGVAVETAAVGSANWTPAQGAGSQGNGVHLVRGNGGDAYLLAPGRTAGGGQNAQSVLYRSSDSGATWSKSGEPCPQVGPREVDSTSIAAGDGGRVAVVCSARGNARRWFVATSTDAGAHFSAHPRGPAGSSDLLAGDPATVLVAAGNDGLARSTDGGQSWQRVADVSGRIGFVGFESPTVGRAVSGDGTTIWTTRDAGRTWQPTPSG